MKILLAAINAKYIHTNLGIYSLYAYARHAISRLAESSFEEPVIEIAEYTINQSRGEILADIFRRDPDVLACSCYLWNRTMWLQITEDLSRVLPALPIWFGGPEVSFDAGAFLQQVPWVTGVMVGEGEQTFTELLFRYANGNNDRNGYSDVSFAGINGIVYRDKSGEIAVNEPGSLLPLDDIVFPYYELPDPENRIIYYETSRGCPFGCSYCLSSVEKKVRLRSMNLVERELQFFLDKKVPQVKFVDRTFNCNPSHTMAVWKYIREHDNGITNFHFELSAELLRDEEIDYVRGMRPGLIQFEIGVQSANPETLKAINRPCDMNVLRDKVARVYEGRNIHQHLDLIAGLPYEDYSSFRNSYKVVYNMRPDQLQLGFLKVLKGAPISRDLSLHGIQYSAQPPYEVLRTDLLSYGDILKLKQVEDMTERYYNSMQFTFSIPYLVSYYENPFDFYEELGMFFLEKGYGGAMQSRIRNYQILLEFAREVLAPRSNLNTDLLKELMVLDLYLRENMKSRPPFANQVQDEREKAQSRAFYSEENRTRYFGGYEQYDMRQIARMTHVEYFSFDVLDEQHAASPCCVYFDYQNRDPLSHQAKIIKINC